MLIQSALELAAEGGTMRHVGHTSDLEVDGRVDLNAATTGTCAVEGGDGACAGSSDTEAGMGAPVSAGPTELTPSA